MAKTTIAPSVVRQRISLTANKSQVEAALFQGLANGTVSSQAGFSIEIDKTMQPPKENKPRNKGIDRLHWSRIVTDEDAIDKIWSLGAAVIDDPQERIELFDIVFNEAHVAALIERWGVAPTKQTFATTGRQTKAWWSDLAVEMVDLFHREGIPAGVGTDGTETIIQKLQARLSAAGYAEEPSARTIRETVQNALIKVRGN